MSSTPLKIVHAVSSLEVGGMEQFVLRIAARQQERGHRVHVLSLREGPLASVAESVGVDMIVLDGKSGIDRMMRAVAYMRLLAPDIVHAHNRSPLRYAAVGKALCGARVVMTRHGQNAARIPRRWEWAFTDGVIAVSHASARVMCDVSPGTAHKVRTIHNGIDEVAAKRLRASVRVELAPTHPVIAIIVARIDHQKGHDTLLRSMARLKEQSIKVTLVVVGDGPNRSAMEDLARGSGLRNIDIRFLGFRNDVADLLDAADIFVLPSLNEGLPLSVLEAMAHGLPVVATRVGGIPELITADSGILIDCGDVEGLASAIQALATDPNLRVGLGQSARMRARTDFSFDSMVDEYDYFYRCVLRRGSPDTVAPEAIIRP